MKIIQTRTDYRDYGSSLKIELQAKEKKQIISFHDGEPEDNTLSRNFSDCFSIKAMLKLAYEAGKAGEEIEFEHKVEVDQDEDY